MAGQLPRVVLVTRRTDLEALVARHGTREQARFFLQGRQQSIEELEARHARFEEALQVVSKAIPVKWRRSRLDRSDLSRFVFEPEDLVLVVGQDGLVANVAKYLDGQWVLGINPDPDRYEGILVPVGPPMVADLLEPAVKRSCKVQERTMVEAKLDDGQRLLALNEVFVGHRTHQSARYRLRMGEREERHSSSGMIVCTGTGSTGWALSIHRQTHPGLALPTSEAASLAYFVREAWPGKGCEATLTAGLLDASADLEVTSEMNEDGVIFGDGIEDDRLDFGWGMRAVIRRAEERLHLVSGG